MIERTFDDVLLEFRKVLRVGGVLEREYMDRPTVELERESDELEEGWDKFLSNANLKGEANSTSRSQRAVAAKSSTPHESTKRITRRPSKRSV